MVSKISDFLGTPREFASQEEQDKFYEAAEALNAEAADKWEDPTWQREQARLIAEKLDWGFKSDAVYNQFFPTKHVRKDEQIVLKERRGLKVFWTHRAGEIDESQLRQDIYELGKDTLGWHVREFEDNVESNYAETIADLIPLARTLEQTEVTRRIFNVLQAAVPLGSAHYIDATSTGSTTLEKAVRSAITGIQDTPVPSNRTLLSGQVSIVGRRSAVANILDFDSFNDKTKDDIARTGVLGTYFGAKIVTIDNYADEDGLAFLPDDELWVIGGGVGLFGSYGGSKVSNWVENKVAYRHYQSRRDVGVAVTHPEVTRRIAIDVD